VNKTYGDFLLPFADTSIHVFDRERKFDRAAVIVDNRGQQLSSLQSQLELLSL
jgi:hypothetical protein